MDQEPHPYHQLDQSGGAARGPRRVPKLATALGLVVVLGLAGTGMAFAFGGGGGTKPASLSSSSASSSTSTSLPAMRPGVDPEGHPRPGFGAGRMGRGMVHGQFTVKNGSGYQTYAVQMGQVTAVSAQSITVKSSDGYTQTYTVQPSTIVDSQSNGISTVQKNDTVRIQALVQGGQQTATNIVDVTRIGDSRSGFGMMPGRGPGMPGMPGFGSSSGTGSASAT